ncbi:MAG: hypothetical protein R3B72_10320 [Polyangiaceae bacterium]
MRLRRRLLTDSAPEDYMPIPVVRTHATFEPDVTRVIAKLFMPGAAASDEGRARIERIISSVLAMSSTQVAVTLATTMARFTLRHRDLAALLDRHFTAVAHHVPAQRCSPEQRRLIGAYFTHEYAVDAAALTNPSMVAAPDQAGVGPDACRFVMSLRGIGEGHISSIHFRAGVVDASHRLALEVPSPYTTNGLRRSGLYDKQAFRGKLGELRLFNEVAAGILDALPERFTMTQLEGALAGRGDTQATRTIHWLAASNYEVEFSVTSLSECVLFPGGPTESHGMEDARFVRFRYDDGSVTYFAPYTAYDGYTILPSSSRRRTSPPSGSPRSPVARWPTRESRSFHARSTDALRPSRAWMPRTTT